MSADGQLSAVLINDEEIGLSSLQRKVFKYQVGDDTAVCVPVWSLHKFDDFETASPSEEDHVVVRRVAEDGKQAEIAYVPLSGLSSAADIPLPDTDEQTSELSSI